ncbi:MULTISPECIES: hypothetical protein [Nocardia]|uniref:hypothetical protein n=1 Tax=Nocardia TaxID=1817 RepID=UPI001894D302|nr:MULTISPECIES: hypothetical protein [Nocardia]MBF6348628.1 hypothetical protein [Nocardia flavorosea]
MSEDIDDIGRETAAMMKTMLQIATLVALKTRERGQREAEARVKLTEARVKEARELQIREARDAKSKDPRNLALAQTISRAAAEVKPGSSVPQRETGAYRGVQLEKDRVTLERFAENSDQLTGAATAVSYDSVERRAALAAHLSRIGIAPELAAARMLVEVGQAGPASEAARNRPDRTPAVQRAREQELSRSRGLERSR